MWLIDNEHNEPVNSPVTTLSGAPATEHSHQTSSWFTFLVNSQVFRPYAKFFLGPLIQLVVCGDNGGDGVHLMVVDIVVTVLSWTSVAKPKVPTCPNQFLYPTAAS